MITAIYPSIIRRFQQKKNIQNENNALSFKGLRNTGDVIQLTTAGESLDAQVMKRLHIAKKIIRSKAQEIKVFIQQAFIEPILGKIPEKWGKQGLDVFLIHDFNVIPELSNFHARSSDTPLRALVSNCSGEIPGSFRLMEGKVLLDIFLPNKGKSGVIRLAQGSENPKGTYNEEAIRILDELLKPFSGKPKAVEEAVRK